MLIVERLNTVITFIISQPSQNIFLFKITENIVL